MAADETCKIAS